MTSQLYEENLEKVHAHLQAEFSNDIDRIMGSVAQDPRFAILTREAGVLEFEVPETLDGVREHYVNLRSTLEVLRSRQIRRIVSNWFVFQQSVATMRPRSAADAHLGSAQDFAVDTAVLFPIAADGILGEIPWNRLSFAEAMASRSRHHEPPTEELMDTVDLHEAFLAAWRDGNALGLVDLLEDDCGLAVRDFTRPDGPMCVAAGKVDIEDRLAEQFALCSPLEGTVLSLVVTDWYIFSNVRWIVEQRSGTGTALPYEMSTATILPISDARRIRAIVGYGTEPVPV
jgi:hypothetical protein